jgi:hypothetical protein
MDKKKLVIVYKKAVENKPELDTFLNHVANQTGARTITNLKNPTTAVKKVLTKQQESPGRNYTLDKVNDIARGRLIYNSLKQLRSGIATFKKDLGKTDMKIAKTDDFFDHPEDGYEGYHIDVIFPNGQHSEIQFHTINSYAATLATHPLHENADHEEMTKADKLKNEDINKQTQQLDPQSAAQVAQMLEQRNAPATQQAQQAAQQTAQGNPPPMGPQQLGGQS